MATDVGDGGGPAPLPTLVRRLHATASQLQWIVDGYLLAYAGLLLSMGSLGDRFGRRLALNAGLVALWPGRWPRRSGLGRDAHRHPYGHGRGRGADHARDPVDHHHRLPRHRTWFRQDVGAGGAVVISRRWMAGWNPPRAGSAVAVRGASVPS